MLTKSELKYYSSLLTKKHRQSEGKFLIEGKRLCVEGLKSNYTSEIIFYTDQFENSNKGFVESFRNIRSEIIKESDFKKISGTKNPQGIAVCFKFPQSNSEKEINSNFIVALESISDPGNLGTILRTCNWFGINDIILSEDCADVYNPKTLRASMGAIFYLNFLETNNFIDSLIKFKTRGYSIVSTNMNGKNLNEYSASPKTIITFSNEANGPSKDLLKISDELLTIPKFGNVESLNVASAAAVILAQQKLKHD